VAGTTLGTYADGASAAHVSLANTFAQNQTLDGTNNVAPNQTAASGSSIMTRALVDARWSKWFNSIELVHYSNTTGGLFSTAAGAVATPVGWSPIFAQMVQVPDSNSAFFLPVPFWVIGPVRVVSYWTDRNATNGGSSGDIAVWTRPLARQPTTNSGTLNGEGGTQIQTVFTANYGGSGQGRFYVVDQTIDFATVSGIDGTEPLQIKLLEFQRRGGDATDTSTDVISLAGVHVFVL
jgi:hypothetical protein